MVLFCDFISLNFCVFEFLFLLFWKMLLFVFGNDFICLSFYFICFWKCCYLFEFFLGMILFVCVFLFVFVLFVFENDLI